MSQASKNKVIKPAKGRGSVNSWTVGRTVGQIVLVICALTIFVPVVWVFFASFKDKSEFYGSPWTMPKGLHWQNFVDAFQDAHLGQYFGTSVFVTALAMVLCLIVALPCSYVMARFDFPGKKILKIAIQGGLFINVNYIVVPIFLMLVDADKLVYEIFPDGFFVNNPVMLAVVYAATSLPFQVGLLNLMQTQKAATNYGRLYAGMVIVMVPVLIFYAIVQKKLLQTSTMGGLK